MVENDGVLKNYQKSSYSKESIMCQQLTVSIFHICRDRFLSNKRGESCNIL